MKIRYLARAIAKRIAPFDLRTDAFTPAANAAAKRRNWHKADMPTLFAICPLSGVKQTSAGDWLQSPFMSTRPRRLNAESSTGRSALAFDPLPAVGREPLLRQETAFVVHFARARDVVENHEGAERARRLVRIEERVDHGEPVAEHVGERDREQFSAAARVDGGVRTAP